MITLFIWLLFAAGCGYLEGILFHVCDYGKLKHFNRNHKDIHLHFSLFRAMFFLILAYFIGIREALLFWIAAIFTFPLIHDGIYYVVRHWLNPQVYEKGFFSTPHITTTAKTSMSFKLRFICFVVGFVYWIIYTQHITNF